MEIIAAYGTIMVILAIVFGLYMTWGVGANDLANAMGTSVGAGAITMKQAIGIAVIFEFLGAVLAGGHVTTTIRKEIIDPSSIVGNPEILVYGMLASLLASAVWLMVASAKGWPVSTTHSIVGRPGRFRPGRYRPRSGLLDEDHQRRPQLDYLTAGRRHHFLPPGHEYQDTHFQYRQPVEKCQEIRSSLYLSGRFHYFPGHDLSGIEPPAYKSYNRSELSRGSLLRSLHRRSRLVFCP